MCIVDIACVLTNICRFTGHVQDFYSVAQHSFHVSYLVPPEFALEALQQPYAAEAYCNDISSPLKQLLPEYRRIIKSVEEAIAAKFKFPSEMSTAVKHTALVMLATERRDLYLDDGTAWPILEGIEPASFLLPRKARVLFLQRYNDLKGGNHG
ncbi:HD family hydrolase [Pantoea stewartii]|uniref:HD family hydrolase n=1 Tax=Pantoea stewartii TaxID=66269 RepID=UPI000B285F3E